jgi:hypothetical protein
MSQAILQTEESTGRMAAIKQTLPTFLGIGAQKSGTTSLHQYLLSHPEIYIPIRKELRFFCYEDDPVDYRGPGDGVIRSRIITTWQDYQECFRGSERFKARGEVSPEYMLLAEKAAPRIQRYLPRVKLFAVLRNPVDRAYSNFLQAVRQGREPLTDFQAALDREKSRIQNNWSPLFWYKRNGSYRRQLNEYFDRFSREQIRVYLFEDLTGAPQTLIADLFRFLGVDPGFQPDVSMKFQPSGIPRFRPLYGFLQFVRNRIRFLDSILPVQMRNPILAAVRGGILRPAPPLGPEIREELTTYFREEILGLQDLLRRDLSVWITPNRASIPMDSNPFDADFNG